MTLGDAVDLIEHLRAQGFHEVDIQVVDKESHWWKYPALAGIGFANFTSIGIYSITVLPVLLKVVHTTRLAHIGVFFGLLASIGIAVPIILLSYSDFGEKDRPFFCELSLERS